MHRLRAFLVVLTIFSAGLLLQGQITPVTADAQWHHLEQIHPGTTLRVHKTTGSLTCAFISAKDDALTCNHKGVVAVSRADIRSIKVSHRGRSTLVGVGAGFGIGFGIGFAVGTNPSDGFFGPNFLRGAVAGVIGVFGAIVGGVTGVLTDFTSGGPLYRAP